MQRSNIIDIGDSFIKANFRILKAKCQNVKTLIPKSRLLAFDISYIFFYREMNLNIFVFEIQLSRL